MDEKKIKPRVAAILVTYNARPWIRRSLDSLRQSDYPMTVWAMDNGSTDDTVQIIQNEYPEVLLQVSPVNHGFGKANNIGMRWALEQGFDYVFLINQDAGLHPDALSHLVQASAVQHDKMLLSPVHRNGAEDRLDFGFAHYVQADGSLTDFYARYGQQNLVKVPFINAALWFIPASIVRRVGLFSPLFFHYGEDVNWSKRLQYHGYGVGFVPQSIGYHDRASRVVSPQKKYFFRQLDWLNRLADPNRTFAYTLVWVFLACMKELLLSMVRFDAAGMKHHGQIALTLMRQLPQILRERKLFTHEGYHLHSR